MEDETVLERILNGDEKPKDLPLELLKRITNDFSEERKIGQGGFGEVYKGELGNKIVAVKRMHVNEHTVDDKAFRREIYSLMNTNHENVVRFLGFCSQTHREWVKHPESGENNLVNVNERLLCSEYISNGSLDKLITDELRGLEWETRYEIITGICKGLRYLHEEKKIIHMDLKPPNILLDDHMVPKITDFGLSRPSKNSRTVGLRFGTQGYFSPEYGTSGKTSFECDIYSLGAIVIELLTGCKHAPDKTNVLRRWRHRWSKPPTLLQYQQVTGCIDIAVHCREEKPEARPSISEIISLLSKSECTDGQIGQSQLSRRFDEDDMLGIKPLELRLPSELNKEISCSIELTNSTYSCIAFNIRPPSRQWYITQPDHGVVPPESMYVVTITVQERDVHEHDHADKFIVQSMEVGEGLSDKDITERMFENSGKAVDKVDLMVVYGPAKSKIIEDTSMPAEEVTKRKIDESASGKDKIGSSESATSKMQRQLPRTPIQVGEDKMADKSSADRRHPSPVTASTTCGSRQAGSPVARLPARPCTYNISTLERMNALLSTTLWVVGKALDPVADGMLGDWGSSKNLGLNVEALGTELLLVKATLETASRKHVSGQATEELLRRLQDSARSAEDLLDELDYFRIQDQLHGTYHAEGRVRDLALNSRHTVGAVLGLSSPAAPAAGHGQAVENARQQVGCCVWPRARHRSRGNSSSSTPNASQLEEVVTGCMPKLPKLGKLLPLCGGPSTLCGSPHAEETPMLVFNRVDVSKRMKHIIEQLQPMRREFTTILQSCDRITDLDIAQSRPITTGRSIEPKLYGRDHVMNSIIHDMTKGEYSSKDLTVLPIVGPGGIGKTTMIQHIYHNEEVQKHFHVVIWVCVSLKFNLNKLLEDIKKDISPVEGEKGYRPEELIEQRLKSKRFLLVLDDIWECSNEDDWVRLLLPLKTSQEKGSTILVTTRFPAVAKMVGTADHSIELEGLESKYFRELFHAFVFGNDQRRRDNIFLLETGDKIMEKLKGSPLAAKTVGRLLRKDLSFRHWRRVLESKEWERQTGVNDIMPALKLSYDYLPFHQQQCFSYSALLPEDHKYSFTELLNLWIGLDILQPDDQNQTLEDMGLSSLNDLVTHGFFREEKTDDGLHYVMHDLLHDLALKVASRECLIVHHSNVGSLEIQPSICHLSIIIDDDDDDDDTMSHENFKSELRKLKTRLKVKQLHSLMLFGKMDESVANILGDLFSEAIALRVLRLVNMSSSVEPMLRNFSALIHLRYLCLGTDFFAVQLPLPIVQLPLPISRFYHLRVLDLGSFYYCGDLPKDLSNLAKLRHFYTQSDELHSDVRNVGKLVLLEELKVFRVNKESEGFEPKQLEHLTELRELGIYNLENIQTKEAAAKAKLIEKNCLERLTLDWDSERSNIEPNVEAVVLESLQPHPYLEELCIKGHGGPSCPTWLGDKLAVEALQSLHLDGVSWTCLPSLGKMCGLHKVILKRIAAMKKFVIEQSFCRLIRLELVGLGRLNKWVISHDAHIFPLLQVLIIRDCPKLLEFPLSNRIVYPKPDQGWNIDWFPKLQDLEIKSCPKFLLVAHIPWTETLRHVDISDVKLLGNFRYNSKSSDLYITGKDDLQSLTQLLAFSNLTGLEQLRLRECPPLEWKDLLMLTSLKRLDIDRLDGLVGPLGGEGDVQWQLPVEYLHVQELRGASGKDLTELLTHLPRLSSLIFSKCENITQLAVGVVDVTPAATSEVKKREDGLLLLPAHLSDSLQKLVIWGCTELVLVDPSTFLPARGDGLQALRSLQILYIQGSPKFLSAISSFSCCLFPSSLQELSFFGVKGMGTLETLSNLTSLTLLSLKDCGEYLECKGLGPLLTTAGQLRKLTVLLSPRFFPGWDPNPRRVLLQDDEGGEEQQLVSPSKLQVLWTDDIKGLLAPHFCSFLSSSLTELHLHWTYIAGHKMLRFTEEQEDALHLLASLQELQFRRFRDLQHLPAGLHKLTNLKRLVVFDCLAVQSLPKDGLPKSLQQLDVLSCGNEELKQQCRGLVGTIPKIIL